jgi:hypothetical protein
MLDKTSSIICAFGLASAAPRSPYRYLELCGIVLKKKKPNTIAATGSQEHRMDAFPASI